MTPAALHSQHRTSHVADWCSQCTYQAVTYCSKVHHRTCLHLCLGVMAVALVTLKHECRRASNDGVTDWYGSMHISSCQSVLKGASCLHLCPGVMAVSLVTLKHECRRKSSDRVQTSKQCWNAHIDGPHLEEGPAGFTGLLPAQVGHGEAVDLGPVVKNLHHGFLIGLLRGGVQICASHRHTLRPVRGGVQICASHRNTFRPDCCLTGRGGQMNFCPKPEKHIQKGFG